MFEIWRRIWHWNFQFTIWKPNHPWFLASMHVSWLMLVKIGSFVVFLWRKLYWPPLFEFLHLLLNFWSLEWGTGQLLDFENWFYSLTSTEIGHPASLIEARKGSISACIQAPNWVFIVLYDITLLRLYFSAQQDYVLSIYFKSDVDTLKTKIGWKLVAKAKAKVKAKVKAKIVSCLLRIN